MMSEKVNTVLSPRESGRYIAANCEHVTINQENIKKTAEILADAFKLRKISISNWRKHDLHPKTADEKAIDLIFAIDVLNFSFWSDIPEKKYVVKYNGKSYTGYWSLVAALRRAEDEGTPVFSADYMANVGREEFAHIFRSNSDVKIPLLEERLKVFNEAGNVLLSRFGGTFVNCVKQCNKDVVALLNIIVTNFQAFRDESVFNGTGVSFYKRAQILVADTWCCFEGKGLGEFKNIDQLTMFADYRVPQALEYFGVLQYSEKLKEALNKKTVLSPGHRYELEIRGCSIESTERLTNEIQMILNAEGMLKESQLEVNSVTVDNYLWDYAKDHSENMKHLDFHLVRTIYY